MGGGQHQPDGRRRPCQEQDEHDGLEPECIAGGGEAEPGDDIVTANRRTTGDVGLLRNHLPRPT